MLLALRFLEGGAVTTQVALSASATAQPSLSPRVLRARTLPVTVAPTPALATYTARYRTLAASATGTASLATASARYRTLYASAGATPVLIRLLSLSRVLPVTVAPTPSLVTPALRARTLPASVTLTPSLARRLTMARTLTSATTPMVTLTLNYGKYLFVASPAQVALVRRSLRLRSLAAGATASPSLSKRQYDAMFASILALTEVSARFQKAVIIEAYLAGRMRYVGGPGMEKNG